MSFGLIFSNITAAFNTNALPQILEYAIAFSPIALAFILGDIFWYVWLRYVRAAQFLGLKYTVLEIRLPKEQVKSPLAMESFLTALHNTSDGNKFAQYWDGETRPWYSLELISVEGNVKFMIWTEDRRKVGLQAGLFSQFPGIEIYEREDYSRALHFDPKTMKMWSCEMKFTKDDHYPIKTYVDYKLDKDPKEEFKVDPLVPFIEWLGTVGPNQQVWVQILIQAHKKRKKPGHLFKMHDHWEDGARKEVDRILMRDPKSKVAGDPIVDSVGKPTSFTKSPTISSGEKEIAEAIERSQTKYPFDVGIRALYVGKREFFQKPFGIGGIIGGFKQFGSQHMNGLKPADRWHARLDYPWSDFKSVRNQWYSKRVLMAYRRRSYFYPPFKGKSLVMNAEELATIYHFPGATAATPTLERVPSKKAEAPTNLPI